MFSPSPPSSFATQTYMPTTGALFSTPPKAKLGRQRPAASPSSQQHGLGYFAFPEGTTTHAANLLAPPPARAVVEEETSYDEQKSNEYLEGLKRQAELQRAAEKAEALRGEENWVRNGGLLRDADGNRDYARTNAIQEELKLRDLEESLVNRWNVYEKGWQDLMSSNGPLRFSDIPWPVDAVSSPQLSKDLGPTPLKLGDITMAKVEDFLLGGLRVRGCTVTRKERIRNSLLRWHPDKMTAILSRVVQEDICDVENGIGIVVRCLHHLNSKDVS
ncbi:uncharacterized protein EV420DRAFT_1574470 [Desarmillaria tabescens]|uniref:Uncharacterized protein n=1 Tax=Armillaria tabescens TaxID=1929756 RepID=A0AA39MRN2_ARMTA|nr:uncharacterized protein EV420DRAFT_1574470 [Desarmillaria tabescens]KAK0444556.1 hypothetical protein EV420DRAFT_1574470 [Desarmillaria tabescens]